MPADVDLAIKAKNNCSEFTWVVQQGLSAQYTILVSRSASSKMQRIIFPDLGYQEALKECNIATLHQRRQWLTERLFNEIKDNSLHKLHGLLPPRNLSTVALRRKRAFNVPLCRTNRLMNSFIMYNAAIF